MSLREINREYDELGRRMERMRRLNALIGWATLLISVATVTWALLNPEAIGAFIGRIASGFQSAVR